MNSRTAGRVQEPTCDEFLERHSDYLDGVLSALESARLALHAEICDACARYDRVVRRGQALVADLPEIEASDEFEMRLQHRLFHLEDGAALDRPRPAGAAAALAVAASLALLAWSPVMLRDDAPATQAASVVSDPLFHGGEVWYPAPVRAPAPMATLVSFPGPHSPLVVSPPLHRGARGTPEYVPVD